MRNVNVCMYFNRLNMLSHRISFLVIFTCNKTPKPNFTYQLKVYYVYTYLSISVSIKPKDLRNLDFGKQYTVMAP